MLRYLFSERGQGVMKGTNLLFTHGSLLLCYCADSHEMCWIKAASDAAILELCEADCSSGFDFIKRLPCFILKDQASGFCNAAHTHRCCKHFFRKAGGNSKKTQQNSQCGVLEWGSLCTCYTFTAYLHNLLPATVKHCAVNLNRCQWEADIRQGERNRGQTGN